MENFFCFNLFKTLKLLSVEKTEIKRKRGLRWTIYLKKPLGSKFSSSWVPPQLSGYVSVPTILPPQVRVLSTPSILLSFMVKFVLYLSCEKNENKQKETGVGPFFTKNLIISHNTFFCQTKTTLLSLEPTQIFLLSLISAETGRKVAPRQIPSFLHINCVHFLIYLPT